MRRISFLICILGISCAAWAQSDQTSWANLSALYTGQKIQIVDVHSKKHSGTFVSFSETGISYQETSGQQTIPKPDVRRVKLMANKHRLRNTLIGAGVGVGAGAAIGAASYHEQSCPSTEFVCLNGIGGRGIPTAIGAVVGLAAGTLVGALVPSHHTIYRVH